MKKNMATFFYARIIIQSLLISLFCLDAISEELIYVKDSNTTYVITEFIDGEFNGLNDLRIDYGVYEKDGDMLYGDRLNELTYPGVVFDMYADPLKIANNYKILSLSQKEGAVFISVAFDVVGKTHGEGLLQRKFEFSKPKTEVIQYQLKMIGHEWKVFQPPLPVIALSVLIENYENEVYKMSLIQDMSTSQKESYMTLLNNLQYLRTVHQ